MSFAIALSDEQWALVADLLDPPGRHGAPAQISRRPMIDAMLFIGPDRDPVALPTRTVRALDRSLEPVAALASVGRVGGSDSEARSDRLGAP